MTALAALFARWGLSAGLSRVLAYVVPIVAGIALLWAVGAALVHHGKAVARAECEAAALKASNGALVTNDHAKDQAGIDRANDTAAITNQQDDRDAAINQAAPGNTGDATRAANCRVWKASHPDAVSAPAGC